MLVAEGALRILDYPKRPKVGWKVSEYPESEVNQFGFRGKRLSETSDKPVVLFLGDSFVESAASRFDYIPERLLSRALEDAGQDFEVASLGAKGYGQDQELLALKEYFQTSKADLVILWAIPDNDVWNNIFPSHGEGWPKPTYRLADGKLVEPEYPWLEKVPLAGLRLYHVIKYALQGGYRDREAEAGLPRAYQPVLEIEGTPNREWQELWDSNEAFQTERFDQDKHHRLLYLNPPSPRIEYGVQLTKSLLQEIEKVCTENSARFVVLTCTPWDAWPKGDPAEDQEWMELEGKYYGFSQHRYRENMESIYGGFPHLVVPCTVEDWQVSPTDPHFNEHAVEQVMNDLAKALIDQGYLKAQRQSLHKPAGHKAAPAEG